MFQDVRYALRTLRQSPAFVVSTVFTLAVGLGLITIAFAIMNAYLLAPMRCAIRSPPHRRVGHPARARRDLQLARLQPVGDRHDLDGVVVSRVRVVFSEGRKLQTELVSGNYFDVLRVRMRRGRALSDVDARAPGSDPVVVLGDQAWARLFDRDPPCLAARSI